MFHDSAGFTTPKLTIDHTKLHIGCPSTRLGYLEWRRQFARDSMDCESIQVIPTKKLYARILLSWV